MTEDFEKLKEIGGEAGERVIESLKDISPDFAGYIIEFHFGDIYSFHSYSMISDQIQSSSMLDVRYLVICGILYIAPLYNSIPIPNSIWQPIWRHVWRTYDDIAFKVGIKQCSKMYNLPFVSAILRLIDDIRKYNKIGGLKKELAALYLQKYTLDQACSRQSQSMLI